MSHPFYIVICWSHNDAFICVLLVLWWCYQGCTMLAPLWCHQGCTVAGPIMMSSGMCSAGPVMMPSGMYCDDAIRDVLWCPQRCALLNPFLWSKYFMFYILKEESRTCISLNLILISSVSSDLARPTSALTCWGKESCTEEALMWCWKLPHLRERESYWCLIEWQRRSERIF